MRPWPGAGRRGALASVTRDIFAGVKAFAVGSRDEEVLLASLFGGEAHCGLFAGVKAFAARLRDEEELLASLFGGEVHCKIFAGVKPLAAGLRDEEMLVATLFGEVVGGGGGEYHLDDRSPVALCWEGFNVKRRAFASGGRSVRSDL